MTSINIFAVLGYSRKYPHTPMYDTELGTQKSQDSQEDSSSLCRIPNPADSNSWGIPEFCKILNGFLGIPVKLHKIFGKFMEFRSGSPSEHLLQDFQCRPLGGGGGGVDIFWNSPFYFVVETGCVFWGMVTTATTPQLLFWFYRSISPREV